MKFIRILIIAILFVLALTLIIQNEQVFTHKFELRLDLMVYKIGPYITSNLVLCVAAFLIGVFFAVIWGAFASVSARSSLKEKDRRIRELEREHRLEREQRNEAAVSPFSPPASNKTEEESKQSTFP